MLAKVKVDPLAKKQRQTVQTRECPQQTDTHTQGRYQTYYLPCYAVDKYVCVYWSNAFLILS